MTTTLPVSAALWKKKTKKADAKKCESWKEYTGDFESCSHDAPFEECLLKDLFFVDNDTLKEIVVYARANNVNTFGVFNAEAIPKTWQLKRAFRTLSFSLPPPDGAGGSKVQLVVGEVAAVAAAGSGGNHATLEPSLEPSSSRQTTTKTRAPSRKAATGSGRTPVTSEPSSELISSHHNTRKTQKHSGKTGSGETPVTPEPSPGVVTPEPSSSHEATKEAQK